MASWESIAYRPETNAHTLMTEEHMRKAEEHMRKAGNPWQEDLRTKCARFLHIFFHRILFSIHHLLSFSVQ